MRELWFLLILTLTVGEEDCNFCAVIVYMEDRETYITELSMKTASIISPRFAVTDKCCHRVEYEDEFDAPKNTLLSKSNLTGLKLYVQYDFWDRVVYNISRYYEMPGSHPIAHAVALVKTKEAILFNFWVQPIALANMWFPELYEDCTVYERDRLLWQNRPGHIIITHNVEVTHCSEETVENSTYKPWNLSILCSLPYQETLYRGGILVYKKRQVGIQIHNGEGNLAYYVSFRYAADWLYEWAGDDVDYIRHNSRAQIVDHKQVPREF